MTITNFNDLREWFKFGFEKGVKSDQEGRETSSPYWTLYSVGLGGADKVLAFNDRLTTVDESFTVLADTIRRMNNPAGSMFRIFQTYRARGNNPTQEARVQIFENNQMSGGSMPGIGSLPAGYVDEAKIQSIISEQREKWELEKRLEDLEAQIKAPRNWTDNALETIERIGNTPFGMVILSKISGIPPAEILKSISGIGAGNTDVDESGMGEAGFDSDIERTTQILGVSEDQLAAKLRRFAEQNPAMARQLFNEQ